MTKTVWVALLGAAAAGGLAWGATPAPKRPPALQAVMDCRQIQNDAQRLACYDAAVGGMAKAEESGDLVAIDREQRVSDANACVADQISASQQVVRNEESARVGRAISELPPDEQEALRRRYLDGQSMVQIAAEMGLT